ncbi:hypothetical protein WA158_001575 [Blastocystis sp. Blastoise]
MSLFPQVTPPETAEEKNAAEKNFKRRYGCRRDIVNYLLNFNYIDDPSKELNGILPNRSYNNDMFPSFTLTSKSATAVSHRFAYRITYGGRKNAIASVCWSPTAKWLITGASNGKITIWDGTTFSKEKDSSNGQSQIRCLRWSHDENWLLGGDDQGHIIQWQKKGQNFMDNNLINAHSGPTRSLAFSPTDLFYITVGFDGYVKLWDQAEGKTIYKNNDHGKEICTCDWHPYNSLVFTGDLDGRMHVRDIRSREQVANILLHKDTLNQLSCHNNGNWIISASKDKSIRLFDIRTMSVIQDYTSNSEEVTRCQWDPYQENSFVSTSSNGSILYWNTNYSTPIETISRAHDNKIWGLCVHPLGQMIATGGDDSCVKIWSRSVPGDHEELDYSVIYTNKRRNILEREPEPLVLPHPAKQLPGIQGECKPPLVRLTPVDIPQETKTRDISKPPPDNYSCPNCYKSGHWEEQCPQPRQTRPRVCHICGMEGHISNYCPSRMGMYNSDVTCSICHRKGHFRNNCPYKNSY